MDEVRGERLRTGLHGRLVDELGVGVCGGAVPPGAILTLDEVVRDYRVSRSVAREAVRVLESMGLLRSRPHVGITVRPEKEWQHFDPNVIRWQLASSRRLDKLGELTQLRSAVEPEAAAAAAVRMASEDPDGLERLLAAARDLEAAGERDDGDAFLEADVRFHLSVLEGSGNRMFAQLGGLVDEALRGRTSQGLTPEHPHSGAVHAHVSAAAAIADGEPDRAREHMRGTMGRVATELRDLAETSPGGGA
jgi:DNA-binding FadR family transcriptional regulator